MKKIYAFFAAALIAAPCLAQKEVVLVSPNDGKEYTDGQTMIITPEIDPEWGDVLFHSPSLKNKGQSSVKVTLKFAPKYSFGSFQCCLGGMCQMYPSGATYETNAVTLWAGAAMDLLTEWNCMSMATYEYEPGECVCTMELYVNGVKGNSYTVKYVYGEFGEDEKDATFDFSKPSMLGIVPSSAIEGEVNVSGPIVQGQVAVTMTGAVEVTMNGPSYFLEIGRAGTLQIKAKSPDKIHRIEFRSGSDVSQLVPNCGTLAGNVWTGDTDCVTFSVEDVRNAFADITAINVRYISNTFDCVDGEEYTNKKKQMGQTVNYTRTFKNTGWQALYVPFSITYDEWKENFDIAEIINFIEYDDDENGTVDRTYLVAIKKASGSTQPNIPYLIRAKATGTQTLTLTDKTLEAAVNNSIECSSTKNTYTFTGTYSKVTNMYANGYYALSGGSLQRANSSSVVLNPQRWYMKLTPKSGGYAATKAQNIKILVDGEDDTEGIIAPSTSLKREGPVAYDLMGRGVKGAVKGISIVNGKKIIK